MDLRNSRRRLLASMCVGLLALFIVSEANAARDRVMSGSGSADPAETDMIVDSVDTANNTITIEGETYSVTLNSQLMDEEGNRIRLGNVRGYGGPLGPHLVRVTLRGSGLELATLEIVSMPLP